MKNAYLIIIVFFLPLFTTSFAAGSSHVQDVERYESINLPNTQVRHIESNYTHKDYKIYVNIPAGYYQHPNKHYPAIFLLDADYSFPIAKGIVEHLEDRNRMSEVFVFGIAYDGPDQYKLNRTRDYTPTYVAKGGYGPQYQKVSGGAPKFEKFLQNQLIPYLDKSFRLNKDRTLVGHSFGGLFATWVSLRNPSLFSSDIIVSPSLWYDNHYVMKMHSQKAKLARATSPRLFFAVGDQEDGGMYSMVGHLKDYVHGLTNSPQNKPQVTLVVLPNEDHDTLFPTALTRGLVALYGTKTA